MWQTARKDFAAYRQAPFAWSFDVFGADLTGATFKAQVRDRKEGGTLRANLATVVDPDAEGVILTYAGSATVAAHIAAGRLTAAKAEALGYATSDVVALSQIAALVLKATMQAMPGAADQLPAGEDKVLAWDCHVIPADSPEFVGWAGTYTVKEGSTE